jgi:hypothetical protein
VLDWASARKKIVKIKVLETWASVVQVVHSSHSDRVHNLHNRKPVFERSRFCFFFMAAAKTARGGVARAWGAGRGHTRGA